MAFCPQTPENLLECPPTPKTTHPSPDSSESESETRSDCERCSICLGKCRNKCFTDSCLHYFCFNCLLEWSKIKAECPLCKASFQSIIHNIKSMKEFDEYLVQPSVSSVTTPQMGFPYLPHLPTEPQSRVFHRVNYMLPDSPRYTFNATMQVRPHQSDQIYQLFMQSNDATERYSREYANDTIPFRQQSQEWRQYIYNRGIYALPLEDMTGRSRECSVDFYRENPAQIYRLMPWINRELVVLLRGNPFQIQVVMNYLPELLTQHDMQADQFRSYFQSFLGQRTDHFIHELLNFARSPYDMIGYDRHVRYAPYYRPETRNRQTINADEEVVISSDNESNSPQDLSSAPQDLSYSRRRKNRTEFTISTRLSSHTSVIFRGSIEASNNNAGSSANIEGNGNSNSSTGNQPISAEDAEVAAHNERVLGSNGTVQIIRDNQNVQNLSDTDSSECEFVLERKPPHLRTPEMVSLNSESDSDVVFVNEEKKIPQNREIPPPGVFEQTKNSSDSSDSDDNKNLTVLRMKLLCARESNPSTSNEPVPSTSTGGFTGCLTVRPPIRFKLRKRVIKSIYDSSSDSETHNDKNSSDNAMIPAVHYSSSSSEDDEPIDVVGSDIKPFNSKRKLRTDEDCPKNQKKQRGLTKFKSHKTKKISMKRPTRKIKSVIVKHSSKGNGFYVAKKNDSGTDTNSSCTSITSSESSDDESSSMSNKNDNNENSPQWSSAPSE
uniref:E3 ubiquitin-protein ligase Topors n=1 Tax=Culicoides sonorensis TaxID=179676 RepID=A0A336LHR4_CULSO